VEHLPGLPGTGIVCTLTKRDALQVSEWLTRNGIDARAYSSDVTSPAFADSNSYRLHLEDELLNNRLKALVATTALGMGYDKPDLGFVVHYQAPGSIVAYYQQVGRAGRSIERAIGVLLAGREDREIHEYFRNTAFPAESHVAEILDRVWQSDGMTQREIEKSVNLRSGQIEKVLTFLSLESPSSVVQNARIASDNMWCQLNTRTPAVSRRRAI
jgi:ATP-dependent DNA helicase RecQ